MKKSVVAIVKGTDAPKMVDEALSLLGGVDALIKPGSKVIIKPNAGHPSPPESSVNTSPAVITAVIKAMRKYKPKEIIVAEAGAVGQDTNKAFDVSGVGKAAKDAGADKIVDIKRLSREELVDVEVPNFSQISTFRLPKFLVEPDCVVVGVPIFKTHLSVVFTGAVKGMKGVVDDKMHRRMHYVDLAEALFDLLAVARPHLSIVDMIRPQEGLGPMTMGKPVDFGAIVAGYDPVAIDAICCRMVGIDHEKTYLEKGVKRGFGNMKESLIEIRGNSIKEVFKKLDTSFLAGFASYPEYDIYDQNACSSCMGIMVYALEALKTQGKYEENKGISLIFGPKKELPKGAARGKDLILVGKCVEKFRGEGVYCDGCPPVAFGPVRAIILREDQGEEQVPVDAWKTA